MAAAIASGMSKVSFSAKIGILMKATSDDLNPPPGYLYDQISNITKESFDYCEYLVEFLINRLNKKSLHVKSKVLLVMKYTLEKGNPEFGRLLRRNSQSIQDTKIINGPPDPLHGDKFYLDIRQNAEKLLEVLFDMERKAEAPKSTELLYQAPIQSSNMSGKMEGFGNTSSSSQSTNQGVGIMKDIYDNVKGAIEGIVKSNTTSKSTNSLSDSYSSFESNTKSNNISRPSNTLWGVVLPQSSSSSNDFLGTSIDSNQMKLVPTKAPGYDWAQNNNGANSLYNSSNTKTDTPNRYDMNETEKRLVNEISMVQGIRPQPAKVDVDKLIKRCHSLNCEVVIEELSTKLQEEDARVQIRVMCVLESMLESTLPDINQLIETKCKETLMKYQTKSHNATRNKANKILELLSPKKEQQPDFFAHAPKQSGQSVDLWGGSVGGNAGDLFSGMNVKSTQHQSKEADFNGLNFSMNSSESSASVQDHNNFDPFSQQTSIIPILSKPPENNPPMLFKPPSSTQSSQSKPLQSNQNNTPVNTDTDLFAGLNQMSLKDNTTNILSKDLSYEDPWRFGNDESRNEEDDLHSTPWDDGKSLSLSESQNTVNPIDFVDNAPDFSINTNSTSITTAPIQTSSLAALQSEQDLFGSLSSTNDQNTLSQASKSDDFDPFNNSSVATPVRNSNTLKSSNSLLTNQHQTSSNILLPSNTTNSTSSFMADFGNLQSHQKPNETLGGFNLSNSNLLNNSNFAATQKPSTHQLIPSASSSYTLNTQQPMTPNTANQFQTSSMNTQQCMPQPMNPTNRTNFQTQPNTQMLANNFQQQGQQSFNISSQQPTNLQMNKFPQQQGTRNFNQQQRNMNNLQQQGANINFQNQMNLNYPQQGGNMNFQQQGGAMNFQMSGNQFRYQQQQQQQSNFGQPSNLNFMNQGTSSRRSQSSDAFSFVQDAMKANKK
uniref:ENTH domain-containing protein n=2 Tax=Clytia hemisphaerica TaxID=252671 RepID=A0A7M5XHP0_9CNID